MFGVRTTVLQSLERGPSELINCDDLAVNDGLVRFESRAIRDDRRIHRREILIVSGAHPHPRAILEQERAVAIEFELVGPFVAFRQPIGALRHHRRKKLGERIEGARHVLCGPPVLLSWHGTLVRKLIKEVSAVSDAPLCGIPRSDPATQPRL